MRLRFGVLLGALALGASVSRAQMATFQEGEAIVGIAMQNDMQKFDGLRLSPMGLNVGVIVQPLFGSRRIAVVDQLSLFPILHYERQASPFVPPTDAPNRPLILNTLWARWSTDEPEVEGKNVFFLGGGLSFAVVTPRDGHKMAPVFSIGGRRWLKRQRGVEVSLQCGGLQVGRTACVLQVTSVWPFG
jgi:hypothetical protein